jgi:hypothetical protein
LIFSPVIVLTGGPGGGKTALINELTRDPARAGRFATLPETSSTMRDFGISSRAKHYQSRSIFMMKELLS